MRHPPKLFYIPQTQKTAIETAFGGRCDHQIFPEKRGLFKMHVKTPDLLIEDREFCVCLKSYVVYAEYDYTDECRRKCDVMFA